MAQASFATFLSSYPLMHEGHIPLHEPSWGSSLMCLERILPVDGPVRNSVHRHSYHELFLFLKGTGDHMIDLDMEVLKTPCIHLVAPGQVHKLDRSADLEGYVLMFPADAHRAATDEPGVGALLRPGSAIRSIPLQQARLEEALATMRSIEHEVHNNTEGSALISRHFLAILLLKCLRWSEALRSREGRDQGLDVVARFVEKVDREFLEKKQVNTYAADLAISPGHLNELVKKRWGRSASDVIHDRLLLEAKRLLLHSPSSVKEVSFALKMEDPAYFARMFRKSTGMTPGEYREHIREKYQH